MPGARPNGRLLLSAAAVLALAAVLWPLPGRADTAGFTRVIRELRTAAYKPPAGAPSVIVHAPPGFDARGPLHLVVFLHGYNGCVAVLMGEGASRCRDGAPEQEGWNLGRFHDAARTNTLLVVPQLAYLQRNGRPGAFGRRGAFRAFLEELLGKSLAPDLGGPRRLKDLASVTLVAHSAGYQTAIAIAEHGGVRAQLKGLVLLDALYGDTDRYYRFVSGQATRGLRFVSLYLARGKPRAENQRLSRRLSRAQAQKVVQPRAAELETAVAAHAIVIGEGRPPHRAMPETHLTELLRGLGRVYLPPVGGSRAR